MAFKNLINSKKLTVLFATLLLGGNQLLMAAAAPAATTEVSEEAQAAMWTGVGYYVLMFLLVCVGVAIVGRIVKVYDLTNQLQGKTATNWNNIMAIGFAVFLVIGMFGAFWSFIVQGSMNLPESASVHGVKTDNMFNITFGITVIVFIITQILLFGFSYFYRGRKDRRAYFYPHNNTIEKVWTIIPAIVLTVLVVFGFFTWRTITNSVDVKGDINIDVTGHQFAWELRYPGADQKLGKKHYKLVGGSNNLGVDFKDKNSFDDMRADTLVIPVGRTIRLNIIAQDVIHSVYMPHFRLQINAVPGLPTYFKFEPTITTAQMKAKTNDAKFEYLLYCSKICGDGHYNMKKIVKVVTPTEYNNWLLQQKPYLNDALKSELKVAGILPNDGAANQVALNN
ncbi:cytochrome c oxidase subunit II [Mucilaginibacter myungsuensis]|uniref:Cytochrome c oxidase subunit 2 n=1 Tax=Mucilaginibacter myungsuensis TaxID=649104 RepID=A0A929PZF5_9SPHI|nr:cytochrome c oxidase subunit II [Mucilaginibacter myungsuensis]MBE9664445.1 cytochrome c oxidase subunit II [Mucilaginibacter myungsuensis]MDN3601410.1 cytochrome c oxidase subunit II [Mucilaginibacter myungsuensis]